MGYAGDIDEPEDLAEMRVIVAVGDWEQEIHEALRLQMPFWVFAPGSN